MRERSSRLSLAGIAVLLAACGSSDGTVGPPRGPDGVASVVITMRDAAGAPLVGRRVTVDCGGRVLPIVGPTDDAGRVALSIVLPAARLDAARTATCLMQDLATGHPSASVVLGFAPAGQLHPLQFVELRDEP